MKYINIVAILKNGILLFVMIFILGSSSASAREVVQIYDSGVYAMTKTLEDNGIKLSLHHKFNLSSNGIANHLYKFNDNIFVNFGVNGAGYISDIYIFSDYSANKSDYKKIILQICKALGMTDDMAEFLFQYKAGFNGDLPNVEINNRRIFLTEVYDKQNNVFRTGFIAWSLD